MTIVKAFYDPDRRASRSCRASVSAAYLPRCYEIAIMSSECFSAPNIESQFEMRLSTLFAQGYLGMFPLRPCPPSSFISFPLLA